MTTVTATPTFTLKNVKTWNASEGQGFSATLYRDGKSIGTVSNDGVGGSNFYHFNENSRYEEFIAELEEAGKAIAPSWLTFELADWFIDDILTRRENDKASKKAVIFKKRPDIDYNPAKGEFDYNPTYEMKFGDERVRDYATKQVFAKFPEAVIWSVDAQAWLGA